MEKLLTLDIGSEEIRGMVLETDVKVSQVRHYDVAHYADSSMADILTDIVDRFDARGSACRVAIGADNFLFRNLRFPFSDRQKIEKILPLELEEQTTYRGDGLHYDYVVSPAGADEGNVLAVMMERLQFVEILAALKALQLDPEIITVRGVAECVDLIARYSEYSSFLLLDISMRKTTMIVVEYGCLTLIRSLDVPLGASKGKDENADQQDLFIDKLQGALQRTLLGVQKISLLSPEVPCFVTGSFGSTAEVCELLQMKLGQSVKEYLSTQRPLLKSEPDESSEWQDADLNSTLALAFCNNKERNLLNLRRGPFRRRQSFKQYRKVIVGSAIPLALLFIGVIVFCLTEIQGLKKERARLNDEILAVFTETFPEVTKIQDPVKQMQVKVRETRELYSGGSNGREFKKIDLLAELSARIPERLPIRLTRFVADSDDLRLRGETEDFNTVDNLQKELEKSNYFGTVEISSANLAPKGDGVRFELRLEFAGE